MVIRQWSDRCFAVYRGDGSLFGEFVAVCDSRAEAETLAAQQESGRFERQSGRLSQGARRERVNAQTAGLDPDNADRSPA